MGYPKICMIYLVDFVIAKEGLKMPKTNKNSHGHYEIVQVYYYAALRSTPTDRKE